MSFYVRSRMFLGFASANANRRAAVEASRQRVLAPGVADATRDDPELAAGFQASPAKAISQGCLSLGSHCKARLGK